MKVFKNKIKVIKLITILVVFFTINSLFFSTKNDIVYLDYQASTPIDKRVLLAMMPYYLKHFANPSSKIHKEGRASMKAIDIATKQVFDSFPSTSLFT